MIFHPRQLYIVALMLLCFSYPITTVWLIELGADVSGFNLVIKAGVLVLFLISLLVALQHSPRLPRISLPLIAFLSLYGIRLLYDVLVLDILMVFQTTTYVFGYFFGLTLIPVIVTALALRIEDLPAIQRWTFWLLFAANVSLLAYTILRGPIIATAAFEGRLQEDGAMEGTALLNPILVGATGAMLMCFVIARLATTRAMSVLGQVFYLFCLFLGGINVMLGASRGPAVALLACIFLLFAARLRGGSFGGARLHPRTWIYVGVFVVLFAALVSTDVIKLQLVDRFRLMLEPSYQAAGEERDYIYSMAWQDFLSQPFLGSSYVVRQGGYSPHNIVLDALMSTGVVGGMVFLMALVSMMIAVWKLVRGIAGPDGVAIGLICACLTVLSMSSGSIGGNPEFWSYLITAALLSDYATRIMKSRMRAKSVGQPDQLSHAL